MFNRLLLTLCCLGFPVTALAQTPSGCPSDANMTPPFPPSSNGWERPIDIRHIGYACTNTHSTFDSPDYLKNHGVRHAGFDIFTEKGRRVKAIADGRVLKAKNDPNDPTNSVFIVEHETSSGIKFCAIYAHTTSKLSAGQWMKKGQMIGTIMDYDQSSRANTNDHLHFGIIPDSQSPYCTVGWGRTPTSINPLDRGFVDPFPWLSQHSAK